MDEARIKSHNLDVLFISWILIIKILWDVPGKKNHCNVACIHCIIAQYKFTNADVSIHVDLDNNVIEVSKQGIVWLEGFDEALHVWWA